MTVLETTASSNSSDFGNTAAGGGKAQTSSSIGNSNDYNSNLKHEVAINQRQQQLAKQELQWHGNTATVPAA